MPLLPISSVTYNRERIMVWYRASERVWEKTPCEYSEPSRCLSYFQDEERSTVSFFRTFTSQLRMLDDFEMIGEGETVQSISEKNIAAFPTR